MADTDELAGLRAEFDGAFGAAEFGWSEDDLIARAEQIIRTTGEAVSELRRAS